jgi:histidyl-tRNA synthetase
MKFHGDWLPEDMARFRKIEKIFRATCLSHGYGEVKTPVIEKMHWFTGAGVLSPELMHNIYTFLDWDGWSGERVVLRPDNTVPVCRLFSQYFKKDKKAKLFYIEDVFRYNPETKIGGRHCQMGVEKLGNYSSPLFRDVEILLLVFDFLKSLKMGTPRVVLSHAGILHAYLKTLNLPKEEEGRAFDLLMEGNMAELQSFCKDRCSLEGLRHLLEMKGSSSAFLKNLKSLGKASKDFAEAVEDLSTITALLESMGHKFEIFPGVHKDLTYYTGFMFNIYIDDTAVGGGGRYDNLLKKFTNEKIGGSGFSIYLEELMEIVKEKEEISPVQACITLTADPDKEKEAAAALKAAGILRKRGEAVEIRSKKDRGSAGKFKGEIKKTKAGYELVAQSGRKKEKSPLPLKSVKKLISFWGI